MQGHQVWGSTLDMHAPRVALEAGWEGDAWANLRHEQMDNLFRHVVQCIDVLGVDDE